MMRKLLLFFLLLTIVVVTTIVILGGGFGTKLNYPKLNNNQPIIFGHRGGLNNIIVENSIESFKKGVSLGFNGIETDVRLTKDQKVVIFHDESCLRLLGIDKDIKEVNWEEIVSKNLLLNGRETPNKVMLLDEYLNIIDNSIITYLDVKVSSFRLADSLINILSRYDSLKPIIVGDESIVFLSYLKYKNPRLKVVLEGYNKGKEWTHYIIPKNFKPDYYSSHCSEVDSGHIVFLKKNKILSNRIIYGVKPSNLEEALSMGVPHIIYDYNSSGHNLDYIKEELSNFNK